MIWHDIHEMRRHLLMMKGWGKTIVLVGGYFNPLTFAHCDYLKCAKELGDVLVCAVNTDWQVAQKKSVPFMDEKERMHIVNAIRWVDHTFLNVDTDTTMNLTVAVLKDCVDIVAKGGDVFEENCKEKETCDRLGIGMVFGVGGPKRQSSSWLKAKLRGGK